MFGDCIKIRLLMQMLRTLELELGQRNTCTYVFSSVMVEKA